MAERDGGDVEWNSDEQRDRVTTRILSKMMLDAARDLMADRMPVEDVTPTLHVMERIAQPLPATALNLKELRKAWDAEHMAHDNVAFDLKRIAKTLTGSRAEPPLMSKGPEDVAPVIGRPGKGAGR